VGVLVKGVEQSRAAQQSHPSLGWDDLGADDSLNPQHACPAGAAASIVRDFLASRPAPKRAHASNSMAAGEAAAWRGATGWELPWPGERTSRPGRASSESALRRG